MYMTGKFQRVIEENYSDIEAILDGFPWGEIDFAEDSMEYQDAIESGTRK